MEPVEINAGEYYLRALRADDLLDDRPALVEAFADPEHNRYIVNYRVRNLAEADLYVTQRAAEWFSEERCAWAIAEPTTGALLGEVGLKDLDLEAGHGEIALWIHPASRGRGISVPAVSAAVRFGFGALGLRQVAYRHHPDNVASEAVAKRCGFERVGMSKDPYTPGQQLVSWLRTAP
ncbi:RimJ/RimL family protein N-acetyltransferase [Amycolatopsis bartoniae]|uniref:N-acetyltransferase n=1 Tax=Amycolatopsis bartoniae TaxID=941986 RepID=A0A8H9IXA2_9PSEU|nr:GNAT family N-acetyltransferase [Amycolatopsis bartoniae]MBB2937387.1 RimJ/RimL family protein N-acetyltransferase [Amycolatopsis bartoniae]TVT01628.1 GNAT family N-acetyltransferase [Amycolatopsis bartoniae]GHF78638.1 N-acetyltransferase [Amycolatopsis bartoniae]